MTQHNYRTQPTHTPDERAEILESGWQLDGPKPSEAEPEPELLDIPPEAQRMADEAIASVEEQNRADKLEAILDLATEATWDDVPSTFVAAQLAKTVGLDAAERWANEGEDLDALELVAHLRYEQAQEAQARQADQDAKTANQLQALNAQFFARPDVQQLAPTVKHFMANAQPVTSPAELEILQTAALRAAQEAVRATETAAILSEFDEAAHIADSYMGRDGTDPKDFDAVESFSYNLERSIDPRRVLNGPTKAELDAQLDEDLFGKQRIYEAGWNVGKSDIGARQLEQWAQKKGLSPVSAEALQYGRKKGWLR